MEGLNILDRINVCWTFRYSWFEASNDNSPAIYRWVRVCDGQSPVGTKENILSPGIAFDHINIILSAVHSFHSCLMHCVFSTKERRPGLTPAICERLWPYLGGIARENDMKALAIGGVADHVHLLLSLPAMLSVSKAMQLVKGNSSKWLRDTFPELRAQGFGWQEGFGAFSIGISGVPDTVHYIRTQEEHHRKKNFREELEMFLKKHGIEPVAKMME